MQKKLTTLIRSVPKESRHLKVYHELDPTYYSATSATFIGRIYRLFGFKQHRRRRRHDALRLPAALRRVHRRGESRHRRARGLASAAARRARRSRRGRAGAGSPPSKHSASSRSTTAIASRWGPRIVDFARAVARGREASWRGGDSVARAHERPSPRARHLAPWGLCAARVPRRLAARRPRRRPGRHRRRARSSSRRSRTSRSCTCTRRSRACRRRSSGSCARRASCSPRSSAACSRSPALRTRASSATRSPTRICSASPPAPASARRSRSRTVAPATRAARAAGGVRRRARRGRARLRARPLGRRRARDRRARPRRRDGGGVHDRAADVRAAAAHATRCATSTRGCSAASRPRPGTTSRVAAPYIAVSSVVLVLHRRVLDVLSLGDEEAASLGDQRRAACGSLVVVAATVGTAAAVSVSGLIGFVGIIVPHTIRLLVSTSYRAVVPLSFVVGGGFLVLDRRARAHGAVAGGAADRRRHRVLRRAVLRRRAAHDARSTR